MRMQRIEKRLSSRFGILYADEPKLEEWRFPVLLSSERAIHTSPGFLTLGLNDPYKPSKPRRGDSRKSINTLILGRCPRLV